MGGKAEGNGAEQRDPESQPSLLTGHLLFEFGFGVFDIRDPGPGRCLADSCNQSGYGSL